MLLNIENKDELLHSIIEKSVNTNKQDVYMAGVLSREVI